jgi:hypothetical protein
MNLDCALVQSLAPSMHLVQACDIIKNGAVRIQTPFLYPDGSSIDLFLDADPENLIDRHDAYTLSDLGQTSNYLSTQQITYTDRRKQLLEDICRTLNVNTSEGVLQIFLDKRSIAASISDAITRLGQACVRAADLEFIQRSNSGRLLRDEVAQTFAEFHIEYKPNPKVIGRYGRPIKLDFEVFGRTRSSLLRIPLM